MLEKLGIVQILKSKRKKKIKQIIHNAFPWC